MLALPPPERHESGFSLFPKIVRKTHAVLAFHGPFNRILRYPEVCRYLGQRALHFAEAVKDLPIRLDSRPHLASLYLSSFIVSQGANFLIEPKGDFRCSIVSVIACYQQ